jgi:hypothetical protein
VASISPIPAINGTCPDGYVYDPSSDQCFLVSPPVSVTATGVSLPDVDPRNAGELSGLGTQDSGLAERFALAHWHTLRRLVHLKDPSTLAGLKFDGGWLEDVLTSIAAWCLGKYDELVALGVGFVGSSATRNQPGFWVLIGELISDLLGVTLDGSQLYRDMQNKGTLPAMRGVGASLINLFVGEFTGTASGAGGNVSFSSNVNPATGLPAATLTPAGGIKAAQALMGFVLSSAVRQGNLDAISGAIEEIPVIGGLITGHIEKYSEAMRANLGIGRMLRFALRPIFGMLIADEIKKAINMEYRPKGFNAAEATRALLAGGYTRPQFLTDLSHEGYTDARADMLLAFHTVNPGIKELLTLRAAGVLGDNVFDAWLGRHGYDAGGAALTRQASDLEPARKLSLALAEHYMLEWSKGLLTTQALRGFIDGLKTAGFLLTPGEVAALENLTNLFTTVHGLRVRHLSLFELKKAYLDGTITLQEYAAHATQLGFVDTDVQILEIDLLVDAKKAQEAAAAKAAAAAARAAKAKGKTPTTPPTPTPGT